MSWRLTKLSVIAALGIVACLPLSPAAAQNGGRRGAVYAMTNGADANEVIAFRRAADGKLSRLDAYETGGEGTGATEVSAATTQDGIDPLASQGSLSLSRNGRRLFAVNAGSGSVSSFKVMASGRLRLIDEEPSGGDQPNSVDMFGGILYVSNVGSLDDGFDSNVTGFKVSSKGNLTPIPGATYKLSTATAQPAQVLFSPDGTQLLVTELTTNSITSFRVRGNGTLADPVISDSAGPRPFGAVFAADRTLLVAEPGVGALSSYHLRPERALVPITATMPSRQVGTSRIALGRDGRYAITSNTGGSTLSSYQVKSSGKVALLEQVASTLEGQDSGPIDSGVSADGRFLYVLDGGKGAITFLRIASDGRLRRIQAIEGEGLPSLGAQGLAVRR